MQNFKNFYVMSVTYSFKEFFLNGLCIYLNKLQTQKITARRENENESKMHMVVSI